MPDILCYGDSNTWGAKPLASLGELPLRYGLHERWAGVLRDLLGPDYWVVEDGLNGRTTVWPDRVEGEYKSGKLDLMGCLEAHKPLDLVVLMLGTNDLKQRYSVPVVDIALGVKALIGIIQASGAGPAGGVPRILLMAPPPLGKMSALAEMFAGGAEKSLKLGAAYAQMAAETGCAFLDAGRIICCSDRDGVHFEAEAHAALGRAVAAKVREII